MCFGTGFDGSTGMFIERLLNQGNTPLVEQAVRFSAARQKLLTEDVANVDTPDYAQKDFSVDKFREMLRDRVEQRDSSAPGTTRFDDIVGETDNPTDNILFHDRNNRSIEQLMADGAKNALYHNMMIEILRKQLGSIESALKERVA
jgi:flagellar basal-body rod protein FlgB